MLEQCPPLDRQCTNKQTTTFQLSFSPFFSRLFPNHKPHSRDAEGNLIVDPTDDSELYCALAQLSALLYYVLSALFSVLREVVQLSVLDEGDEVGPLEAV